MLPEQKMAVLFLLVALAMLIAAFRRRRNQRTGLRAPWQGCVGAREDAIMKALPGTRSIP